MKKYSELFVYLVMLYITSILVANVAAFKIVEISLITVTGGTLVFPISYILGDVFSEIYGFKTTRKVIIGGFLCNALMVGIFYIAIKMPYPDYFENQEAFSTVLGSTPRIFLAGVIAYLIGSISNSYVMNYIKNNSKIQFLWFRTIISTIIGEALDSVIFLSISFIGTIANKALIEMIICQALVKIVFEIIMTPVTYKVISFMKKREENSY